MLLYLRTFALRVWRAICCSQFLTVLSGAPFLNSGEVLSESAVMEWFTTEHSPKGKSVFLAQMDEMIKWLQTAEEED